MGATHTDRLIEGSEFATWFMDTEDDDQPSVGQSRDVSGHELHLDKHGGLTSRVSPDPVFGEGYDFDGTSAYLDSLDDSVRIHGDLSIAIAFDLEGSNANIRNLIMWGATGESEETNFAYLLSIDREAFGGNTRFRYLHETGDAQNTQINGPGPVANGFHTLTLTRDTAVKRLVVHIDDVEIINTTYTNNPTGGTAGDLFIGSSPGGSSGFMDGAIYEMRVWSRLVDQQTLDAVWADLPGAPQNLTATPGPAAGEASLTWSPPEPASEHPVNSYTIYRSTSSAGPFSQIATVTAPTTSYTDSGLTAGTTYYYRVTATGDDGEGPPSLVAGSSTVGVPEPPQALTASRSGTDVVLDWLAPTSDGGRSIQHYTVYESSDESATYAPIATVAASTTAFQTPACDPECYYQVTATNSVGESAASNPAAALAKFTGFPPESIRGTTPGAGAELKQAFPCGDEDDDSINVVTGEFVGTTCLFTVANHFDLGVSIDLTHRSNAYAPGIVGWNWELSIDRRIDVEDNGDVFLSDGYGRLDRFITTGANTFASPPGFYQSLERQADGTYRLDHTGGVFETFAAGGARTTVGDAVGNLVRFTHDSAGRPVQIQDPAGRVVTFVYGGGLVEEIRDWTGRTIDLTYNAEDELISVEMPADGATGPTHQFTYTTDHNLDTATDPELNTYIDNQYDATTGRVDAQTNHDGTWTFSYDPANAATTVTDPNGNPVIWTYDSPSNPLPVTKQVISSFGVVRTTTYETNANQEITRIDRPGGNADTFSFDDANPDPLARGNLLESSEEPSDGGAPLVTTFTYESVYQQVRTETSPLENNPDYTPPNGGTNDDGRYTKVFWYGQDEETHGDLNGDGVIGWAPSKVVRIDYPTSHAAGTPHTAMQPSSGDQARSETFVYNEQGQVTKHTDVDGSVTLFEYYGPSLADPTRPEGYVRSITYETSFESPPGEESTTTSGFGTMSAGGGSNTTMLSASTSELSSSSSSTPSTPDEYRYTFTYDEVGNVATLTDPAGRTTSREYDALNQVTRVIGPAPASLELVLDHDDNGNVVKRKVTNAEQDTDGTWVVDSDHPFVVDEFEYDALDRVTESRRDATRPADAPASTAPETLFDEFAYDKNGNLVLHRRHAAVVGDDPNAVDSFVYDEEDRLVTATRGGLNPEFAVQDGNAGIDVSGVTDPLTLYLHGEKTRLGQGAASSSEGGSSTCFDISGDPLPPVCIDPENITEPLPLEDVYMHPLVHEVGESADDAGLTVQDVTGLNPFAMSSSAGQAGQTGFAMDTMPPADNITVATVVISGGNDVQNKIEWQTSNVGPIAFQDARLNLVFWTRSPGDAAASADTWRARVYGDGNLIASTDSDGETSPAVEPVDGIRQYRMDLGVASFTGTTLRLELELAPGSTPPSRFVHYDSFDAPARLEIGRAVTTTSASDANGNLVASVDGNGVPTYFEYDGFDRRTETLRPDGTRETVTYDPAGRVTTTQTFGALGGLGADAPSDPETVLLEERRSFHDEAGRVYQQDVALFDPATGAALPDGGITPGDGFATTLFEYDEAGRLVRQVDDNGAARTTAYDGLGRVASETDTVGTQLSYVYDEAGNLAALTATELLSGGGTAAHTVLYAYDELDRVVRVTDPLGQTKRFGYDSRGNLAWETDARGPVISDPDGLFSDQINDHGNLVEYVYDAADRLLATNRTLTDTGEGDGTVVDHIVTGIRWDGEGRIVNRTDDNGNPTAYEYDAQGRLVGQTFADGTVKSFEYDGAGNLVQWVDATGRVVNQSFDDSNRLVARSVDAAGGTPSVTQAFEYDGLGRLTLAADDNDPAVASDDSVVTFAYDSVSRPTLEDQDGYEVSRAFDGVGNLATLTYPNGREITRTYDALDRLTSVTDATGTIQSYAYDGTRLVSKTLGNGISTSLSYDDALRLVVLDHATASDNVRFDYAYGRDNQRTSETFHHAPPWSQEAAYDSVGRLDATTRSNHAGLDETATPIAAGLATAADWDLDGANNWLALDETRDGAASTQTRTHGPTNEIDTVTEGSDTATFTHDADGNRLTDGEFNYTWDAFGRLRTIENATTGVLVASYTYDALDRRVTKTVAATDDVTGYVYDGAVVVEERDDAGVLLRQFVHGQRIDEVLAMDRNLDADASATGSGDERVYYVHDALGTVVALTSETGHVVEGYLYDAYGAMVVVGPGANGSIEWGDDDTIAVVSAFDNPYGFTGQRFDSETGFYYYRARYYDAEAGRFLSRDPIGVWGDPVNMGNAYGYVGNRPFSFTDPSGMFCWGFSKRCWEQNARDATRTLGATTGAATQFTRTVVQTAVAPVVEPVHVAYATTTASLRQASSGFRRGFGGITTSFTRLDQNNQGWQMANLPIPQSIRKAENVVRTIANLPFGVAGGVAAVMVGQVTKNPDWFGDGYCGEISGSDPQQPGTMKQACYDHDDCIGQPGNLVDSPVETVYKPSREVAECNVQLASDAATAECPPRTTPDGMFCETVTRPAVTTYAVVSAAITGTGSILAQGTTSTTMDAHLRSTPLDDERRFNRWTQR